MSTLLLWAFDEVPSVPITKLFSIKKKKKQEPQPQEENEDIVLDEIGHVYCSVCNKNVDGNCCKDDHCPW